MTLQEFEKQLRQADWLYLMSDDYMAYSAGRDHVQYLWDIAMTFGEEGEALFDRIRKEYTKGNLTCSYWP